MISLVPVTVPAAGLIAEGLLLHSADEDVRSGLSGFGSASPLDERRVSTSVLPYHL
jgi:hypothetical protein